MQEETPFLKEAVEQINVYLRGERQNFNLSLKPQGAIFR